MKECKYCKYPMNPDYSFEMHIDCYKIWSLYFKDLIKIRMTVEEIKDPKWNTNTIIDFIGKKVKIQSVDSLSGTVSVLPIKE